MTSKNIIMMAVAFTGALVVVGNGCSRFITSDSTTSTNNSSDGSYHDGTNSGNGIDVDPIMGAPTVTTVYSKTALKNYETMLGVKASSRTETTYLDSRGAISGTGSTGSVTGPMAMAITAIVGDMCGDVIDYEIANGENIFLGFDFTKAGLPTNKAIDDAIEGLAYVAWEKDPTQIDVVERQALRDMLLTDNPIGITEQNGQYKAALMLCTAALSTTLAIIR